MNAFLDLLKFIFCGLLVVVIVTIIATWFMVAVETLNYTEQNNVLLRELCIENEINVDSALNVIQNDTLNVKINFVEE